ncbi:MAG: acetyl-CoA carboxylase biotin carboxyl carrier protein subunit [Ignavibacteria bacterium]|jgi:biotin carboxyl carrier protein|nr:acetyl-CoA carboxylase biotin carboxyl carrier protein subunit [Ignavibacteria bacterium]
MKKLKITLNGKIYEVDVEILKDDDTPSMPFMPMVSPMAAAPAPSAPAAVAPKAAAPAAGGDNTLTAPMNGVVIEIPVKVGDAVKTGQVVVILEAMKMKTNISSSRDGKIASIAISPNDSVESGQLLLTYA